MPHNGKSGAQSSPESRLAPEPEGPEEVYRRFERMNRRGGGGSLRELVGSSGKNVLYGAFAVVEVAAIVSGFFFDVPLMDLVALGLPGLLIMFHNNSKNEDRAEPEGGSEAEPLQTPADDSGYGSGESPEAGPDGEQEEEKVLETLLRLFGVEIPEDKSRFGDR